MFAKRKDELNKQRHKERRERAKLEAENPQLKEERLAENITQTIESKRVYDESVNVEIEGEDEFKGYFEDGKPPKVLITTNAKAHKEAYRFTEVFQELIPNSTFLKRKDQFNMKQMSKFCANRDFTDLIVVNEDKKVVNGITFDPPACGPSFYFSVSSLVYKDRISGHGRATSHVPELILNNFTTRLRAPRWAVVSNHSSLSSPSLWVARSSPCITSEISSFSRRHRYMFKNEEKVGLQGVRVPSSRCACEGCKRVLRKRLNGSIALIWTRIRKSFIYKCLYFFVFLCILFTNNLIVLIRK